MTVDRDCREAGTQDRSLDLPLIDQQDSGLWAGIEVAHRDRSVWPALTDALSESGHRLLWDALHEAIEGTPGDPERALMVVEAFWRTMQLRRGPNYAERMAAARPTRTTGLEALRARVSST